MAGVLSKTNQEMEIVYQSHCPISGAETVYTTHARTSVALFVLLRHQYVQET